jgi:tight adherence protein B
MEIPILIFVLVTVVSLGCLLVGPRLWGAERKLVKKRLIDEFSTSGSVSNNPELFQNMDAIDFSPQDEYALLDHSTTTKTSFQHKLTTQLEAASVSMTWSTFLGMTSLLGLSFCLLGFLALSWTGAVLGLACGLMIPFAVLNARRGARRQKFQKQLPSAFELMARVIKAGQSVPQAFEAVAEAFEPPLSTEFGGCQRQQALGLPPDVVLQEMANRNDIVELRIFAMSMLIQRQMGGNLSEVLERLAALIRQRLKLQQHVRTLTAEGRLQGITLTVLPFVMFIAMYFLNRHYAVILLEHPSLILATLALMGIGMLWIRRIVRIDS